MCEPPRVVKVNLRADGPWPAYYEVAFTCGHPAMVRATERQAALALFGVVLRCLRCERARDV